MTEFKVKKILEKINKTKTMQLQFDHQNSLQLE